MGNMHRDWTEEQWKKVKFSNERKFNIVGFIGSEWCWKTHGEPLSNCGSSKAWFG